MSKITNVQSIGPDVLNDDGTVTRVVTTVQTFIYQPDEYQTITTNLQKTITDQQTLLANQQAVLTQAKAKSPPIQVQPAQV